MSKGTKMSLLGTCGLARLSRLEECRGIVQRNSGEDGRAGLLLGGSWRNEEEVAGGDGEFD